MSEEKPLRTLLLYFHRLLLLFSVAKSCLTLCNPIDCSTPGFPDLHHLLEFAQTHVHWVRDAIQPSYPLSPPSLPSLNLSQQQSFPKSQLFASGGLCISMSPSNEYSGLISFRIDWFDLLAVKETLKSLLQHHSLKTTFKYIEIKQNGTVKPL